MTSDFFGDFPAWAERLREQTIVRTVEQFEELDSTNRYALERLDVAEAASFRTGAGSVGHGSPFELPALIVARRQTDGRGRGSNRWWSADGALTFSLIVDEAAAGFAVGSDPRIALLAGLAVADALDALLPPWMARRQHAHPGLPPDSIGLKWPNDVLVDGRKVCGILTEVSPHRVALLDGRRESRSDSRNQRRRPSSSGTVVIGVGLNVNNSLRDAPPELRETATALCDVVGGELSLPVILLEFCRRLERRFQDFIGDPGTVRASWGRRCALTGRSIAARIGPEIVTGRCAGIHDDGSLIVQTPAGERRLRSVDNVRAVDDVATG
jgi:BirA family transcriptional regulator, biotin operon repressor / biotin---[acetyl-CoA-carboxylase] ligase